jgi:pSer/pThr/pTyr-binding forkhead associated (FHA) protein
MPAVVLDILKYFFLFLIFLFLARAVKAMYLEISGTKPAKTGRPSIPVRGAAEESPGTSKPPDRLSVTAAGGRPKVYDLEDELIIGRGDKCHVVIGDSYASQVHARVFRKGESVYIEDMGSTNGTYLNRRKVTSPTRVGRGDTARIGKTELEFKR